MTDRWQQVAELHAGNIDQGFLATLGQRFLRLLYRSIDESPSGILLVEERDGRVAGFIAGSIGMAPILGRLLRHPLQLAAALLPIVVRPRKLAGMAEVLRAIGRGRSPPSWPHAELLSLAVAPGCRRQGVAESLYARLRLAFLSRGVGSFRIIVGESLAPAQQFYERMGAQRAGRTEVHHGRTSIVYVQQSEPDEAFPCPSTLERH